MPHHRIQKIIASVAAVLVLLPASNTFACSMIFLNENNQAKVVVRTMDLPLLFPEAPRLVVFPRGMERDSARALMPGENARILGIGSDHVKWKTKLGSVVVTGADVCATDGLNEKGLAAHFLEMSETVYEPVDSRPEMGQCHLISYVLDNFETVDQVVRFFESGQAFRLVPVIVPEKKIPLSIPGHLAVQDPSGDSAIIEWVHGKVVIHHGHQYRVMTNEPEYDVMLERMSKYAAFGGKLPLPGDIDGEHRFARLAAYYDLLPKPNDYREAIAMSFSLMRVAQIPFRDPVKALASNPSPTDIDRLWSGIQTNWVSGMDLTSKTIYMNSTYSPSLFWLELSQLDFTQGAPIEYLNPHDIGLSGNARSDLQPWPPR